MIRDRQGLVLIILFGSQIASGQAVADLEQDDPDLVPSLLNARNMINKMRVGYAAQLSEITRRVRSCGARVVNRVLDAFKDVKVPE